MHKDLLGLMDYSKMVFGHNLKALYRAGYISFSCTLPSASSFADLGRRIAF